MYSVCHFYHWNAKRLKEMEEKILWMNAALSFFVSFRFFAVISNILTSPVSIDVLVDFVP
jgi:hypothetical protein